MMERQFEQAKGMFRSKRQNTNAHVLDRLARGASGEPQLAQGGLNRNFYYRNRTQLESVSRIL